ncbi:unnamed protein product [Adineta ricciae]|uniref:PLAT domain-containing protein n=1 Tax=Adineta ricciae TaxID=249248 RepID=A0A815I897_ADIRI|nr:unnamed protein product [Adineta ricciae]
MLRVRTNLPGLFGCLGGISYNQPKFCPNAPWNSNASTFENQTSFSTSYPVIFIDRNNMVYMTWSQTNQIIVWSEGNSTPTRIISGNMSSPSGLFVTTAGDIYINSDYSSYSEVDKWTLNSSDSVPIIYACHNCHGIFIDINNIMYCSMLGGNQVVTKSLYTNSNALTIVAGTGTAGSGLDMLNQPRGFFVDTNLDLYVADSGNNRIQLFQSGQLNGTTVAGLSSPNITITLNNPTAVVLDADKNMYIVDAQLHRIVVSGPGGFRTLLGIYNSPGSAANQFNFPISISFDSYGNIFVVDYNNNRIQKFDFITDSCNSSTTITSTSISTMSNVNNPLNTTQLNVLSTISSLTTGVSYNQPTFLSYATWSANAITFQTNTTQGMLPFGMFIDINNTIYVSDRKNGQIKIWFTNGTNVTKTISGNLSSSSALFVTVDGGIYVDNGLYKGQIDQWSLQTNTSIPAMHVNSRCIGLFVDINNNIYCSMDSEHQVVSKSLNFSSNALTIVAGTGCQGSVSNMLDTPYGIFVDTNLDLYVADSGNNRIQLFQPGQLNAITVAGLSSSNITISLNNPVSIILDFNKYLFIVDNNNNRIIGSGPNGFRCLVGCTSTTGSASNQLNFPTTLNFDSYGNLFVVDQNNARIQKFIQLNITSELSYNQPMFCSNASWDPNAITFSYNVSIPSTGMFIDTNNTIYIADGINGGRVQIWLTGSTNPTKILSGNLSSTNALFVSITGDIYIDNGLHNGRVDKWKINTNISVPTMYVDSQCISLFIDISNTLYCSLNLHHYIAKRWLNDNSDTFTVIAGTNTSGSNSNMLNSPHGIFVDNNLNLYVADFGNNRIQLFALGISTAVTIAGNGSSSPTITLNQPTCIVLDGDNHFFIVDSGNHRIIGSGPNGFQCLVGCQGNGSTPNQLSHPSSLSFDSYGNMFVIDLDNKRIQKFLLLTGSCDKKTTIDLSTTQTTTEEITSSAIQTSSQNSINNSTCFTPKITLIPGTSTLLSPIQFRRSEDFYIVSIIELNCQKSLSIISQWTIKTCNLNCSQQIEIDPEIKTTFTEISILAQTLPYGVYELTLTVTMRYSPTLKSSSSVYIQIISSNILPYLIQSRTSMITHGHKQNLLLDPGTYSINPDNKIFNASNWKYEYYCRIYDLHEFPNLNGSLLTIDDQRNDSLNPSCLSNRTGFTFNNMINSSLTILSNSLQSNRTYQFMIHMKNRQNSSLQATGYLLVQIVDRSSQTILIDCVISTLCASNLEFQLINPTTQVALFSICIGNCTTLENIMWNIYSGIRNSSSNMITWTLFNQTTMYEDIWFFGRNTSNFTSINQLFLSNSQFILWKFEVIYTFVSETSISSLNFVTNQSPSNGSCSINPLHGTTTTLFNISCSDWFDDNGIKDYSVSVWTNDFSQRMVIAYSSISLFQVRFPAGDNQTGSLHLILQIRDTLDCITEVNMSSIIIGPDYVGLTNLINDQSENQNIVGQLITSLSQQFNQINIDSLDSIMSNEIPITTISITLLASPTSLGSRISSNRSMFNEYNKQRNVYANVREYLINFITKLAITTIPNSIKLQATSLAQISQSTNQLTRTTLSIIANQCYQLTIVLNSLRTKIPFEDVQIVTNFLMQCATNVLSAVNGPLQERIDVLDSDFLRSTMLPDDYDTDLELEWSNLKLFADGNDFSWETIQKNRNIYYQKQLANEILNRTTDIITLLTSSLNIHLNLQQNFQISTRQVFMSLETKFSQSLSNQLFKQLENAQIQLPENFKMNQTNYSKVFIRSIMQPLAPLGNSKISSNTNLSRTISFSILDQNQNEIPIETNSVEMIIPRDSNLVFPSMILQNVTWINSSFHNQLFHLQYLNITTTLPKSIHFEIQSLNATLAYLFIHKFDQIPQLNSSINLIDGWKLFCASNLTNENIYTYFIDNQQTFGHQTIIFGLRELNSTEMINVCSNISISTPPITNERFSFTSNYQLRIYTSGCYYLDENQQWKADGLIVGPKTNHNETQCFSNHLTTFTGEFEILPAPINWNYVFANADFMKNKTIYLTIIIVLIIYMILLIYARSQDKKDVERLGVTPLPDNHSSDKYFYQIIVFTGQRKNSGTKSKVQFVLSGDHDESLIRTFADSHRQIFQRGGIDAFIMAVPKSLGLLNYVRIWHDNTGQGSSSSWFLKYLIICDLQTMEKFHFICQRWFAVEKDDGKIERLLLVANENEKHEFSYLLSKGTYHSISDGHLWFSIFSRPPSNVFTRVQRCTCCFVLLFISMLLNIMYYDLSNEAKININSTNTMTLSFGFLYITPQQIMIGIVIEAFSLIPGVLLIQIFRRLRARGKYISPLQQTLSKMKPFLNELIDNQEKKKKNRFSLTLPWWWIFIAYGFCIISVTVSILFIFARGIEFGDSKTQKWLTSILSGFFSSILLTQPLKILCLAIVFACFYQKSNEDKEAIEYLHDTLDNDDEYLHSMNEKSLFTYRPRIRANRLNIHEVACARRERLKEIRMWLFIQDGLIYLCFLILLYFLTYLNPQTNSYFQVNHLRNYFLNFRQTNCDYTKISTIDEYWNWLENSFVDKLRAQQWYNGDPPRNLSGFINDKSSRLIGWATMRQLRIKYELCHIHNLVRSECQYDYNFFNEDKQSLGPGWSNETKQNYSSSIRQSFQYKSSDELDTYIYIGDYATYNGGGYVYEFRGRLCDLQSNLSKLHHLGWIDSQTRAIFIQFTLYNPNVQLFTSMTFLAEILPTGGIYPTARFEPMSFYGNFIDQRIELIIVIIYMIIIIYFVWNEFQSCIKLQWKYFCQFWSLIEVGIIGCSWTSLGIYVWRLKEYERIGKLFSKTNGYVYINLQLITYINNIFTILFGFSCFFGTIKFICLCRFNQRLCLFIETLRYAGKELFSFAIIFSFIFMSFVSLFYLLFTSKISSCSTLLNTCQMLLKMMLMQFNAYELITAAAFLGPFCFSIFIILVVFVCLSMFVSIINDGFRRARENINDDNEELFSFMIKRFQRWMGFRKPSKEELQEEKDIIMRSKYIDSIECFPDKIDRLLDAINRVSLL